MSVNVSNSNFKSLKIVATNDLTKRSYVSFYMNDKRYREFNGNNLGLDIKPNYASSIEERDKLLRKLHFELLKALENNSYPIIKLSETPKSELAKTTAVLLKDAIDKKLSSNLNRFYKRNLQRTYNDFVSFLNEKELNSPITSITKRTIEKFLQQFNSSGTYYMNKRRDLGVLFSTIGKEIETNLSVVLNTERVKSKATLHKIYSSEQLKSILAYLEVNHPNLHLCCLLTYGCLLRPHEEIRNLRGSHFKDNFREIHLSGEENKSGRIRTVYVPEYAREVLLKRAANIQPNQNLFSSIESPLNEHYFATAWRRHWDKLFKLGLIQQHQTIYSFRHTAAVNIYKKTKDLHLLQKVLGHSDMIVTLKYLRGLGEINDERLKDVLPEL